MGGNERLIPSFRIYFRRQKDKHVNLTNCGEHGRKQFVLLEEVFPETQLFCCFVLVLLLLFDF